MGKKKLVLGATGFIGSAIMRGLIDDGEELKVLIRKNSNTSNIDKYDVEKVYGDIRDGDSIKKALEGCDTLFLTAADFHHWAPDPKVPYAVNVVGTRTTLKAALESGIDKVVYTSTNNTMGAHGYPPVTEDEKEFNHWKTGDHYSMSKYLAEVEAFKYCAKGLPVVIVNPTFVIGINDVKPTPSGQMIIDVASGREKLYMDARLNIGDVEDVARGHILAAKKGRVGERYLLGGTNVTVPEFYKMIADIAGVTPPRIKVPYPVALATGYFCTSLARITKKDPLITPGAVKIGHMGECYDSSKAYSELGMPHTPLEVTIKKAIDWFRENGYLK